MEPAREERDDLALVAGVGWTVAMPQWSPLVKSGMTRKDCKGHR